VDYYKDVKKKFNLQVVTTHVLTPVLQLVEVLVLPHVVVAVQTHVKERVRETPLAHVGIVALDLVNLDVEMPVLILVKQVVLGHVMPNVEMIVGEHVQQVVTMDAQEGIGINYEHINRQKG